MTRKEILKEFANQVDKAFTRTLVNDMDNVIPDALPIYAQTILPGCVMTAQPAGTRARRPPWPELLRQAEARSKKARLFQL